MSQHIKRSPPRRVDRAQKTDQPGEQQQQQPLSSPAAPVPPPRTPQEVERHSSPLPDQPIEENLGI